MSENLAGTVALVTGASSGIGEATAIELAARGATVAAVARRADRLADVVGRIEAQGGRALAVEADIADRGAAEGAVARTVGELGRLDILINNAGLMLLGGLVDADPAEWERMVSINVMGLMYTSHAALPHLLEAAEQGPRQVADLVNVSSVAGRIARFGAGAYNVTKWGVNAFTEALRQEVTERHVRVGVIEPGATESELLSHNRPEIQAQGLDVEKMTSQDIAETIAFMVTRPRRTAVSEVLIRPTEQVR